MDPISLALAVASYALPKAAKWIFGDDGEKAANTIVDVARAVTGKQDPNDVLDALKNSPALVVELQKALLDFDARMAEEETKRLLTINETMRKELDSEDPFVRRWRPFWGYVSACCWAAQTLAIFIAVVGATIATFTGKPDLGNTLLDGLATLLGSLTVMWSVALAVLGIQVAARSRDKAVAAGEEPLSIVGTILGALRRRRPAP